MELVTRRALDAKIPGSIPGPAATFKEIMNAFWQNIISIIVGALIGFLGTYILELKKEGRKNNKQKQINKQIIKGLEKEIEEGLSRYGEIVRAAKAGGYSKSRIFVSFWDSVKLELLKNVEDVEILFHLFRIYYYFDLVNFHAERGDFENAAGFALEYPNSPRLEFEEFKKLWQL